MDKEDYLTTFDRTEQRESRSERKKLKNRDRSQYKKSDLDQRKKQEEPAATTSGLIGRVSFITGQEACVVIDHEQIICTLRGTLKQECQRKKNLLAVGDIVQVTLLNEKEGFITCVQPRKTQLSRADNLSRQKEQLIATNIDQVLITVSLSSPELKQPIIDRYLIAARQGNMDAIILINKIDLLDQVTPEEQQLYEEICKAYAIADVPLIAVSPKTGEGMDKLISCMQGKASLFAGQSGVGKSSLINAITGKNLATRHTVSRTGKGAHTTTKAELITLPCGGWLIDTPGIRSFGLWELPKSNLPSYFPEIQRQAALCYFANCTHTTEGGCAVIEAVEEGVIHILRYESYCALFSQLREEHLRR